MLYNNVHNAMTEALGYRLFTAIDFNT